MDEGQSTRTADGTLQKEKTPKEDSEGRGRGAGQVRDTDTKRGGTGSGEGDTSGLTGSGRGDGREQGSDADTQQGLESDIRGRDELKPELRNHFINNQDEIDLFSLSKEY